MKKIFLDCGSNCGQGFEHFNSIYGDEYEYHMFEANPNCQEFLIEKYGDRKNIIINKKAVFNKDGEMKFHWATTVPTSVGGSLIYEHNDKYHDPNDKNFYTEISVETVDIGRYIDELYENGSEIILKLDVESSEYDILESLIETKTIHKLKTIYCEFHTQYMKSETNSNFVERENNILQYVRENNIDFHLWD